MNILSKVIVLGALALASVAACDTDAECVGNECRNSNDREDALGAPSPDFRRFEIEIVGEGTVVVNEETCTTADGICSFEVPMGAVITLAGDFSFSAETANEVQEGRCISKRACQLVLRHDVHLVADVESGLSNDPIRDRKSFGLLAGQPGIVIDAFGTPYSRHEANHKEGGQISN